MCGLAGFVGIPSASREALTQALARGIDKRGNHGAGFVSCTRWGERVPVTHALRLGGILQAPREWLQQAATGDVSLLHTRFATCGKRTVDECHPYAVARPGTQALYVAHNGIIDDARESAKEHGRPYVTDSKELAELLACGDVARIARLSGYGTLAWLDGGHLYVCRMTSDGEAWVGAAEGGGTILASTASIGRDAMRAANLKERCWYELAVGDVYELRDDALYQTPHPRVTLAARSWGSRWTWEDFRDFGVGGFRDDDDDDKSGDIDARSFRAWLERQSSRPDEEDDDGDAYDASLDDARALVESCLDDGDNPTRDETVRGILRDECSMLDEEIDATIARWADGYYWSLATRRDDDDDDVTSDATFIETRGD